MSDKNEKIPRDVLDELLAKSKLSDKDIEELGEKVDQRVRKRIQKEIQMQLREKGLTPEELKKLRDESTGEILEEKSDDDRDITELKGLGKDFWKEVDEYIRKERGSWNG